MNTIVETTLEEWQEEGKRLFGEDEFKWEFVCPSCGHVQSAEDFRSYKEQGATPNTAMLSCIGRYDGHMDNDAFGSPGKGKEPCNYTSGGLFNINPVSVLNNDGTKLRVFDFNRKKS